MTSAYFNHDNSFTVLENAPMEIFYTDEDGRVLFANKYAMMAWGLEKNNLESTCIFDITVMLDSGKWKTEWVYLKKEGSLKYETTHESRAGFTYPVEVTRHMIKQDGRDICCTFARDIADLRLSQKEQIKALKKAEESDRLKSEFLANLSHEIRTPMNAVIGFSNLLKTGIIKDLYSKEQQSGFIELIQENGKQLLNLIDDIIDFSKIEANQLPLIETECSISELFTGIKSAFAVTLPPEIQVTCRCSPAPPDDKIIVDKNRLKQVLTNLLSNARKHTEKGYIRFGCRPGENGTVCFYVEDSGSGIPDEKKEEIFNRFHQLNHLTPGAGLGLNICKGLINLMGGRLWFESEVGKGTTFYFELPASKF